MLPQLQHKALIIEDIQNAVAAGKIVTISQKAVSQNGWTGVGYSIVDPSTGAGAYLIGGAADGGVIQPIVDALNQPNIGVALALLGMVGLLLPAGSIMIGVIAIFSLFMGILTAVAAMYDLYESDCPISDVFGFGLVTAIFTVIGLSNLKAIAAWIGISSFLIFFKLPDIIKEGKNCNG